MDLLDLLNKYAGIGSFVVATVSLFLKIWTDGHIAQVGRRRIASLVTAVLGALLLVVPGVLIYQLAILLATSSTGTAEELVVRSATWATIIGAVWGIVWVQLLLPPLTRWLQQHFGGT